MQKLNVPTPAATTESPRSSATNQYLLSVPEAAAIKDAISEVKAVSKTPTHAIADANNWSPSLQHVLDQPPAPFPRRLLLGGIVFCLAFGAWATFGQIDEVGHAQGRLVPKGEPYKIQPVVSGKVAQIDVKEGEMVQAGQVLVELDPKLAANEVEQLQQQRAAYQTELLQTQFLIVKTRLEAQTLAESSKAGFQAATVGIAQAKAKAQAQGKMIAQTLEKAATTRALLTQQQADLNAHQARLAKLEPLVKEGSIGAELLFQAQQDRRNSQFSLTQKQGELQKTIAELDQLHAERQQVLDEPIRLQAELAQKQAQDTTTAVQAQQKIQQLEVKKTQLEAKFNDNELLQAKAITELKQRSLISPVTGVVLSLNVRNIGEVVQTGQTIAEIAPHNAQLILLTSLPNKQAGFVKKGMDVQVKFDAYPYQDYGIVPGFVNSISPDTKPDQELGSVYQVEVALARNYLTVNHQPIQFKAGETATANIIIRRRRIADILLEPIKQLQKGGIDL